MQHPGTLIVGQGLAGSLMAFMLHRNDIPFTVMDAGMAASASLVAAGMFTPVSGKRKTLHPLTLAQIPFAINIYQQLEKLLQQNFMHLTGIHLIAGSPSEAENMLQKTMSKSFSKFIAMSADILPGIRQQHGAVSVSHSGWVNCSVLLLSFKKWLQQNNQYIEAAFDYNALRITSAGMHYGEMMVDNIIFCEGYRQQPNPFFAAEKIIPCRGDVLTVSCKQLHTERIIKKDKCYLVPLGNGLYKAGATYGWQDDAVTPAPAGRQEIENQLQSMLQYQYQFIQQQTAIRPTTQNREIIIKQHSLHKNIFMLNGLGTKGVLQGPWWAARLAQTYFNATNAFSNRQP